jgi:hypothetical protein
MKEKIKRIGLVLSAVFVLAFTAISVLNGPLASAVQPGPEGGNPAAKDAACQGAGLAVDGVNCASNGLKSTTVFGWVGQITSWILWAVGAVCVIFIIIGGIKYATSGGDSEKVKKAKDTLLYAIIGLAIALLASVIVSLLSGLINESGIQT